MNMLKITVALVMLVGLTSALSIRSHEAIADFCWRDSIGRGVGVIPSICPSNKDKIGLLCYSKCPAGYTRFGFDCHQNCPSSSEWVDQGLFCRLSEYGRTSGYPWKFGDWFNDDGMISRCEADFGKGNCEKYGLMYYPKCKAGFYAVGCCICRPNKVPDCTALGFNGGLDLSCAKYVKIGDPKSMDCANGQIYDAGLCYDGCQAGFNGVGPVCWAAPPANWVYCGMGAAKDTKTCTSVVFDQVSSVGNMALNVATLGAGKASSMAKNSAEALQLKQKFEQLKKLTSGNKKIQALVDQNKFPGVEAGKSTAEILKADPETISPEDIVRVSSQIAALADPTGAADVVSAYTYSKCKSLGL